MNNRNDYRRYRRLPQPEAEQRSTRPRATDLEIQKWIARQHGLRACERLDCALQRAVRDRGDMLSAFRTNLNLAAPLFERRIVSTYANTVSWERDAARLAVLFQTALLPIKNGRNSSRSFTDGSDFLRTIAPYQQVTSSDASFLGSCAVGVPASIWASEITSLT